MPHSLTVASLILRLCAGFIAALSFYMAFFMYEDEKGAWQNRLENLWASVYDRAKVTDGTTTALFNRLAEAMKILFEKAFGRRLLSLKAVFVSANLTLGLGLIASMVPLEVRATFSVPIGKLDRQQRSAHYDIKPT